MRIIIAILWLVALPCFSLNSGHEKRPIENDELMIIFLDEYLHNAVCKNDLKLTLSLLESGACVNAVDDEGRKTYFFAITPEMVLLLFRWGSARLANRYRKISIDNYGQTAIHFLLSFSAQELAQGLKTDEERNAFRLQIESTVYAFLRMPILDNILDKKHMPMEKIIDNFGKKPGDYLDDDWVSLFKKKYKWKTNIKYVQLNWSKHFRDRLASRRATSR